MKKLILLIITLNVSFCVRAQKVELSVQANSGMFHYMGQSPGPGYFVAGTTPPDNYAINHYGKNLVISYGGGAKATLVIKNALLFGVNTDYELLRSKVNIAYVYGNFDPSLYVLNSPKPATGSVTTTAHYFNISPFIGGRVQGRKFSLDVMPGIDIAFGLKNQEKGTARTTTGNESFSSNRQLKKPETDVRVRIGFALNYNRFTINTSYSKSLDTQKYYADAAVPAHRGELARLGIGYLLY